MSALDPNLSLAQFSQSTLAISSLEDAQNMTDDIDVGEEEAEELTSLVGIFSTILYTFLTLIITAQRGNDCTC